MIEVIAGIGIRGETKEDIEKQLSLLAGHVEWVHFDIADDTLVPNTTFLDFENFPQIPDNLQLEAHLMVEHPEKYITSLSDAGFSRLIAHVECNDPRYFLEQAQYEEVEVGLAIDGPSEFEILEPFLDEIDVALIMTIEAGFSGQPFLPEALDKVRMVKEAIADLPVQVDGGMDEKTARLAIESGADRLVSTGYLFKHVSNLDEAIARLKRFEHDAAHAIDDDE